ncbi:hypothetical protein AB833_23165 [Chromatiales bacterium (ex Bugula neritina AB1)]|nr:hypothetical protein AB833_23165 [Chromatiales bacterium (ex Bugula neritina AB1)]
MGIPRDEVFGNGTNGYYLKYLIDSDNAAMNTGGIFNPRETTLPKNLVYWRFISTSVHNRFGAEAGLQGMWWVTDEDFKQLLHHAVQTDAPLAEVAAKALCIPPEWGDMGYVIRAVLNVHLKAWFGQGKPATAGISVGNPNWDPAIQPAVAGVPGLSEHLNQLFIPDPGHVSGPQGKDFKSYFRMLACKQASKEYSWSHYMS